MTFEVAEATVEAAKRREFITSPITGEIVRWRDPDTGETHKVVCPECLAVVLGHRKFEMRIERGIYFDKVGVGDPAYFIAAGVDFKTVVVPHFGRVAYTTKRQITTFLKRFSPNDKRRWKRVTGLPYPYKLFQ